jgi:hypothetical protein
MYRDEIYASRDGESKEDREARIRKDLNSGVLKIPCLQMDFVNYNLNFAKELKYTADGWEKNASSKEVSNSPKALRRSTRRVPKKRRRVDSVYDSDSDDIVIEDNSDDSDEVQVVERDGEDAEQSELPKSKKRARVGSSISPSVN